MQIPIRNTPGRVPAAQGRVAVESRDFDAGAQVKHDGGFVFVDIAPSDVLDDQEIARAWDKESDIPLHLNDVRGPRRDQVVLSGQQYSRLDEKIDTLLCQVQSILDLMRPNSSENAHPVVIRPASVDETRKYQEHVEARKLSTARVEIINDILEELRQKKMTAVDAEQLVHAERAAPAVASKGTAPATESQEPILVRLPLSPARPVLEPTVSRNTGSPCLCDDLIDRVRAHLAKSAAVTSDQTQSAHNACSSSLTVSGTHQADQNTMPPPSSAPPESTSVIAGRSDLASTSIVEERVSDTTGTVTMPSESISSIAAEASTDIQSEEKLAHHHSAPQLDVSVNSLPRTDSYVTSFQTRRKKNTKP